MLPKWQLEPDDVKFDYRGYSCKVKRNPTLGFLCGYVVIPKNNKFYNVRFTNSICDDLRVWGGVTYGEQGKDGLYRLGFDCAHFNDVVPYLDNVVTSHPEQTYKDVDFVKSELHELVDQIIACNK